LTDALLSLLDRPVQSPVEHGGLSGAQMAVFDQLMLALCQHYKLVKQGGLITGQTSTFDQ
jgi:hypothetical protein